MKKNDFTAPLMSLEGVREAADAAFSAIARAHRRPAGLRQPDVISSESLLRGARVSSTDPAAWESTEIPEVSAYSLLAPELLTTTVRTFARAPLQILARLDVALGGPGTPADAARAQALARFITHGGGVDFDRLAPAVVHAEIAAGQLFGPRSEVVARVAGRVMAVHTGLDPRCFAVPENLLRRRSTDYAAALARYAEGQPRDLLVLLLEAWAAGGDEADGIARAV